MNKKYGKNGACSSVHGIQFMPDKLRRSRTRQTLKNLEGVDVKHYDEVNNDEEGTLINNPNSADANGDCAAWLNFNYPFENIVLSGGGSKGYAYVGALKVNKLFK